MPSDKKRTNVALSEEAHKLAKDLAARDHRTIGLLIEFLLRKYAEDKGWRDLLRTSRGAVTGAPELGQQPRDQE